VGVYKKVVITNAGRAMMARSIAGEVTMQFSRAVTSSHIYPSDTDFKGYTSLEGIQQTVIPSNVQVVNDTLISVRNMFGNESISESYLIQNIGLYATDGNEEVLFSVSQATAPDEMPAYNGVAPSSFIYTIQATFLQASSLSLTINPAGTATAQDIQDLDGAKLDKLGDISETVVETLEPNENKFPIPAAGETIKRFMGKILAFLRNIKPLEADMTYYVATTGSDVTGDGTFLNPFKTIQRTLDSVPKDLGGCNVNIIIANGTYEEEVRIQGYTNGRIELRSNDASIISTNVNITNIIISKCLASIQMSGVNITTTSKSAINISIAFRVVLSYVRIAGTATNQIGVECGATPMMQIYGCMISNRRIATTFTDASGYINNSTGINNVYTSEVRGVATLHIVGTVPSSTNGHIQASSGMIINENGTQITHIINTGLSCTWGTIQAGYNRHGNSNMAMITIQIRIITSTTLTGGNEYTINGFPAPFIDTACAVSNQSNAGNCYIRTTGQIVFKPNSNVVASTALAFNCTYLTAI